MDKIELIIKNNYTKNKFDNAANQNFISVLQSTIDLVINNQLFINKNISKKQDKESPIYLFNSIDGFSEVKKYILLSKNDIEGADMDDLFDSIESFIDEFSRFIRISNKQFPDINQLLKETEIDILKKYNAHNLGDSTEEGLKQEFKFAEQYHEDYVSFFIPIS